MHVQKLHASDAEAGDAFGVSVSVSGDTALIGAYGEDSGRGAVYVYTAFGTTWTQQATLKASDGVGNDQFGCSVAVEGNTALIGAYGDDAYTGSAYVFIRIGTTWTQQAKLTAPDGVANDAFGSPVALSGDTALIGATGNDDCKGTAYVFTRIGSNWTQQARLTASDGASYDFFCSVSLCGDTAVIGAYGDERNTGSAYVFTRNGSTWTQQAKLNASDGEMNDYFGSCVSLSGDTVLIGAPMKNGNGTNSGSAYLFTQSDSTWTQQAKLLASDSTAFDMFGCSVRLSGGIALIGADGDSDNGYDSGSAYIFTRTVDTWAQQEKLLPSDGMAWDFFGTNVALAGNTALIGACGDDDNGTNSGSAYVFTNDMPPDSPIIHGQANGKARQSYNYTFQSADPEGDDVYYLINWGDNTSSGWVGPYSSGAEITQSHTWPKKGTYVIQSKAKDVYGNQSEWAVLEVTMPFSHSMPFLSFWARLFDRFPHAFPLLQRLVGY